jgi:hypothetical protein
VRGPLCRSCNTAEPHRDDTWAMYRERHPAAILGFKAVYVSPLWGEAKPIPPELPGNEWLYNPLWGIGL